MVFLYHLGAPPVPAGPLSDLYAKAVSLGWSGVDLFFTLSAFLITYLLLKERNKHGNISFKLFFLRRALRIWPLYYLSLAIGFFLLPASGLFEPYWGSAQWLGALKHYCLPFATFLGNYTMLDSQTEPSLPAYFRPLWSICMEEQFYVVWCLSLLVLTSTRSIKTFLGCACLGGWALRITVYLSSHDFWPYYHNTLTHLDPIILGALLGTLEAAGKRPRLSNPLPPAALWTGLILVFPRIDENHPLAPISLTVLAIASSMTLLCTLNNTTLRRWLSHRLLVRYGRLTYGLYIFHMLGIGLASLIVLSINPWTTPFSLWLSQLGLGLAFTLGLAQLSWLLLEKPCQALRHRLSRV